MSESLNESSSVSSDSDKCIKSWEKILRNANLEIEEAETLIESIGEKDADVKLLEIDDNIVRLESSQQQISEVLRAFKELKHAEKKEATSFQNLDLNSYHQLASSFSNDELNQIRLQRSEFDYYGNGNAKTPFNVANMKSSCGSDPLEESDNNLTRNREQPPKLQKSKSFDLLNSNLINNCLVNFNNSSSRIYNESESRSNSFQSEGYCQVGDECKVNFHQ